MNGMWSFRTRLNHLVLILVLVVVPNLPSVTKVGATEVLQAMVPLLIDYCDSEAEEVGAEGSHHVLNKCDLNPQLTEIFRTGHAENHVA